jgi:hypothetical protein
MGKSPSVRTFIILAAIAAAIEVYSFHQKGATATTTPGHIVADSDLDWNEPLPRGAETDIVALDRLVGNKSGAKYMEKRHKGRKLNVRFKPLASPLPPKKNVSLFTVTADDYFGVEGGGPFYLIGDKDRFFILTEENFARLYEPLERADEVLDFMSFYLDLFRGGVAYVVTEKNKVPGVDAITSVEKTNGGFNMRLITHNFFYPSYVAQEDIFVGRDGSVKSLSKMKVIKNLGQGLMP